MRPPDLPLGSRVQPSDGDKGTPGTGRWKAPCSVRAPTQNSSVGTAEISLIVSGISAVAAVGTGVITYRLATRRFDHERRLSDLDAVRVVLDDAAGAMQRAHSEMAQDNRLIARLVDGAWGATPSLSDEVRAFDRVLHLLDEAAARLRIRFGSEHEIVILYEAAVSNALEFVYRMDQVAQELMGQSPDVGEEVSNLTRATVEFGIARQSFTLVAYRVAGVQLPAVQLAEVQT
jgi:hypothetical protein